MIGFVTVPALIAAAALAAAPAPARRVAVLDFAASWSSECVAGAKLAQAERERCEALQLFADEARGGALAILRPPAFVVMTRENTAQILKDMGGQCSEGECEVETARLLGASVVVSGQVNFMEGTWIVSLKVHDVATAALLGTGKTRAKTKLDAFDNVRAETERMLKEAVALDGSVPAVAAVVAKPAEVAKPPPAAPPAVAEKAEPAVTKAAPAPAGREAAAAKDAPPAAEPGEAARRIPAEAASRRWSVELRGELAPVLAFQASSSNGTDWPELDPTMLVGGGVRAGYGLDDRWTLLAGFAVTRSGPVSSPSMSTRFQLDAKVRVAVGAAWSLPSFPSLGFAAEVGVARTQAKFLDGGNDYPVATTDPLFAAELRLDHSLSREVYVGARLGILVAYRPSRVFDSTRFRMLNAGVYADAPFSVDVGYRF